MATRPLLSPQSLCLPRLCSRAGCSHGFERGWEAGGLQLRAEIWGCRAQGRLAGQREMRRQSRTSPNWEQRLGRAEGHWESCRMGHTGGEVGLLRAALAELCVPEEAKPSQSR